MNDLQTPAVRMQSMSDEHLITLFQNGEKSVFEVIVLRHQERVRNFVYSILGTANHIDDISQEVFIKIFEALSRFRFESSFTTWIYRITLNHCRDELRKQKIRRLLFHDDALQDQFPSQSNPFDHTANVQLSHIIQRALTKLPFHYRTVVTLRDMEDYSYNEIAEVLQCDLGTVKSRLARARGKLREILSPVLSDYAHSGGKK